MDQRSTGISRRGIIRGGTVAAGSALVGMSVPSAVAFEPVGPGEDGAPASDERFAPKFDAAERSAALAVETSYNGWPVGTPASSIGVAPYTIPGTSLSISLKSGDVATVMLYVARRFNAEVEALRSGQVGGYSYRKNVNNPSVWSNHASGTAMDLNWELHPNGSAGTFSAGQVSVIRNILNYVGAVVFWGGDYRGTIDEMHFEINVPPGDSRLTALAQRISGVQPTSIIALQAVVNGRYVVAENGGGSPLIANRGAVSTWEQFGRLDRGGSDIALRSEANKRWVCADNYGNAPLMASRDAVDTWETFEVISHADGTVSLRSRANNRFLCAENGGNSELRANRDSIDVWEKFKLIQL